MDKRVADSRTFQAQLVMQSHINGAGRLFGGLLMEWIDVVAGVTARRHSGMDITTAAVDRLEFLGPAYPGNTIVLDGRVTCVGKTSMEVRVDTYVEKLSGERTQINRAYIVMVAIGLDGKPHEVPRLICETPEEIAEFENGLKRQQARKANRA